MNKMQKGIVAVTVLVIAIILMIAIIIAAPKTTVKREADIEQKSTYVDADKTLTLWYSDDACDENVFHLHIDVYYDDVCYDVYFYFVLFSSL